MTLVYKGMGNIIRIDAWASHLPGLSAVNNQTGPTLKRQCLVLSFLYTLNCIYRI